MVSEDIRKKYWDVIRRTRSSGRIAQSVIERVEKSWEKYDEDVIREALEIHIARYAGYKENYTVGIMRNLQKQKEARKPVRSSKKNSFHNFHERDYDFAELEKQLINR